VGEAFRPADQGTAPPPTESAVEGVRLAGQILTRATNARWPMYLRNVKQILRQTEGGFDERRFGFAGLMDLLRALQRDGVLRVERDRRGGLRVFQGPAFQRAEPAMGLPAADSAVETRITADEDATAERADTAAAIEVQPGEAIHELEAPEPEEPEAEPIPVDTTAELLGRAKPKRRTSTSGRSVRKAAAPRKTVRRAARGKKAASAEAADGHEPS
jgi:hypothetical protein